MLMNFYSWNDDEKQLRVYCRESGGIVYECCYANFREAKKVADAFVQMYDQGKRHGKLLATEEVRRTLDHIDAPF